jgi:hypothetical protein
MILIGGLPVTPSSDYAMIPCFFRKARMAV